MRQTKTIAFSGIITALSFIVLLMTGLIPFGTFLLPTFAGLFILSIKVEYGYHYAVLSYVASSILSLFFCPDKTAMIVFVLLLGYYPLFKIWIEHKLSSVKLRYFLKFLLFTVACSLGFLLLLLFFPAEIYSEGILSPYLILGFYFLGIITFFVYDIAINQILAYYIIKIKNRR